MNGLRSELWGARAICPLISLMYQQWPQWGGGAASVAVCRRGLRSASSMIVLLFVSSIDSNSVAAPHRLNKAAPSYARFEMLSSASGYKFVQGWA